MGVLIGTGGGPDAEAAALFVRAQVSWLRRGLDRAEDPTAVALVLTVHDTAHRGWLELLPRLDGPARASCTPSAAAWPAPCSGALTPGFPPRRPPTCARCSPST
jgi:hypothetical protein